MARNTIKIKNNGVQWNNNIERSQAKKYITDDNPDGDIVKIGFAGMQFIIPFKDFRKISGKSFFDLNQMGELGKWKISKSKK
jgi:hypothetical protein